MRILFELSHPKHYYQFRCIMNSLINEGHDVNIVARDKDVLLNILQEENQNYLIYGHHGKSILRKFTILPILLYKYYKILKKINPDIIVSKASPYAVIMNWFFNLKTIIAPDSEVVQLTNIFVAPKSSIIITPKVYSIDYGRKHRRFNGFFEDCYLHPSVFRPRKDIITDIGIDVNLPYFILRFISWTANHDINKYGFSSTDKMDIVNFLIKYGRVYISSEGKLPDELNKYKLKIPASKLHDVLHFATMYIGDSQTMATEAALLGTPAIRYNSFVGPNDMSNFIVLEKKHQLLRNFSEIHDVKACMNEFIINPENKKSWLMKRRKYYSTKSDANSTIKKYILNA